MLPHSRLSSIAHMLYTKRTALEVRTGLTNEGTANAGCVRNHSDCYTKLSI